MLNGSEENFLLDIVIPFSLIAFGFIQVFSAIMTVGLIF